MAAIAVAVAVLVIGLSVYSSISERGREFAALKALGLRTGALLRLVLLQASVLAVIGTGVGVLLSLAVARAVQWAAPQYLISIPPSTVGLLAASALGMAALAAVLPGRYLARLDPATALQR
jgi:putative ABC transport system permease protein